LITSLLFAVSATWAATITDDFNRADTVSSTDTTLIGADWAQSAGSPNRWRIGSNTVYSLTTVDPGVMYNTARQTIGGGNGSFTITADVAVATSNVWAGVAFNYQDDSNYYCVRFKGGFDDYQLLARVGGAWTVLRSGHAASVFEFGMDTFYRVKVSSDYAYGFTAEITDLSTTNAIVLAETTDPAENFSNGYAGLLLTSVSTAGNELARFDNFNLETASVASTTIADNFNRPDTVRSNETSLIGADWNQESTTNEWLVNSSTLASYARIPPGALYNDGLEAVSGNGTNFTVKMDVRAQVATAWVGLVFNYQDAENYYCLRFKGGADDWQLLRRVDDSWGVIKNGHATEPFTYHTDFYTLTVKSDTPYDFDFTFQKSGSPEVLNTITNGVDGNSSFTGGHAGAFVSASGYTAKFDNFRLTVATEAALGYAGWAATWGVDIGAEGDDPDGDGLLNLYEYGLRGDPTNALDQGTSPEYSMVDDGGSTVFQYIYPQLSDPQSGLSYHIELNPDLVTGSWADAGYTVEGTNVTGGTLDFVTNSTDTVDGEKFIQLIIQ